MKKIVSKVFILIICLAVSVGCLVGCDTKWEGNVTLTNWGSVVTDGGFIAETDNYVYYINGTGSTTADNTFGTPVKGTLMAADKSDLTKTEIVVPKLFVASDYTSGIKIVGDYVYYGTPCTSKDSSGNIANSYLTFFRTKLDGTDTTEYFTVSGISTYYRIVTSGSTVYIVYYDSEAQAILSYNTATKSEITVAETSTEVKQKALSAYNFVTDAETGNAVVVYTVTVYKDYTTTEDGDDRETESYNQVYYYKVGDTVDNGIAGTCILDGKDKNLTYAVTLISGEYMFYTVTDSTQTDESLKTRYYGVKFADLGSIVTSATEVTKASTYVASTSVINALDVVYVLDSTRINRLSLLDVNNTVTTVAIASTASTLLFIDGDFMYFVDSSSTISRIKIANVDEDEELDINEQVVSERTVDSAWFTPKIINNKLFYVDNSSFGGSYVYYMDLTKTVTAEDTDDDGENDKWYFEDSVFLGKKTDADIASNCTAYISAVADKLSGSKIVFDTDDDGNVILSSDGLPTMSAIDEAKTVYNSLNDTQKDLVSESLVTTLNNYTEALRISQKLYALNGFDKNMSATQKDAFKDAYTEAKKYMTSLKDNDYYTTISGMLAENMGWFYQTAAEYFED